MPSKTTEDAKTAKKTTKRSSKEPVKKSAARSASKSRAHTPTQAAEATGALDHRTLLAALRAFKRGEFDVRLPDDLVGIDGQICATFNDIAQATSELCQDSVELSIGIIDEGRTKKRLKKNGLRGDWGDLVDSQNRILHGVVGHTRNITELLESVSVGVLRKRIDEYGADIPLRGSFLRDAKIVNTMVDQLDALNFEMTRVALEVGVEGRLGAQAKLAGVEGSWRQMSDAVNLMASSLTGQVREIARVTTAVALGDLTKSINIEVRGEVLELKNTINTMVDQLGSFADEVTRVAREVGSEGILGGQAQVRGVSGVWRELTENVNGMANNLTGQVRNIAEVATAIAKGDLSKKITVTAQGEILELKSTINTMVDQLGSFADEVTRVAREVGTDGILGGDAEVGGVSGVWRELTENVNSMANNLTAQVRNIAEVVTAIAEGDLSKQITVDARGEILTLKNTINMTVDKLNSFSGEVTRVARLVGTEGTLGVQAEVKDVSGVWRELTENVNQMGRNLADQVRDIAEVTTAVAKGDLSKKITVEVRGEILELKLTINDMVDQLGSFAREVTRMAREVGTEGVLGGQAEVRGVSGVWEDLTDNVNNMASNLTNQVRNISEVARAVAAGDLSKKITVGARGEVQDLKETLNAMVDQLNAFGAEVIRVARDVGVEGRLGGQAIVVGVRGSWKELTDNVNMMANNLTSQVRDIADVTTAVAKGDLTRKIAVDARGEILELKNTINTMVDQLSGFAVEVTRLASEVGIQGKLGGQADVRGVSGTWRDLTDAVNSMANNLTDQVRNISQVATAIAQGDLQKKIVVEASGEILELKSTINTMVDQLGSFADEVTRVAREVGTEGTLGGQAEVRGVSGIWEELTNNVNLMARNLTEQVRGIAGVVTAVANGDLDQRLQLDASGEIATLVDTINNMTNTLSTFADQVTSVARSVGVEGLLGGQADVPGAAGIWRDLVNNVNELAGNLTRQVRAIGDVAIAVTKGDMTQLITVVARGEVATLKDNLNQMIGTLGETTQVNHEQDWLKTNLTRFTRMLQGQRDLMTVARRVLSELAPTVGAQHGVFYMTEEVNGEVVLRLFASYAYKERKGVANQFKLGEGLVGQAALERERILITDMPDRYIKISSALGEASPRNLVVVPILFEDELKGVIELASLTPFSDVQLAFLDQLLESLGIVIATIEAQMRTDELLRQSQGLAEELQIQQEELQQTNEELEEKARELSAQKTKVERKNQDVETARQELEVKAGQLALTSKYKSQFLANMSHELRTPLNSLLILSKQLANNHLGNLQPKQVEYASTIHSAGEDLLALINEILDLAKVESGTMRVEVSQIRIADLKRYVDNSFSQIAEDKNLEFIVSVDPAVAEYIETDDMRLKQVLRNLLANALKFTEHGQVVLRIESTPNEVISFAVHDTGIGIASHQHRLVFEAFQQADGGASRSFGGTGLGLSISREIAKLLGGTLEVESEVGKGSTFTLRLPLVYREPSDPSRSQSSHEAPAQLAAPIASESESKSEVPSESSELTFPRNVIKDDRRAIVPGDRVLLVVEDETHFATIVLDLAREAGFKCIVATTGVEALEVAAGAKPDAIILDLRLPDMDGWVLLDRLKHDVQTRHIPVHIMSAAGSEIRGMEQGAIAFLQKPISQDQVIGALSELGTFLDRRVKRLLIVEDDDRQRQSIIELIGDGDVESTGVSTGEQALAALDENNYDCMVLDLNLPGMSGIELINKIKTRPNGTRLPIIIYTGKELTQDEETALRRITNTIIVKDVRSPERLLDETALFLHRVQDQLPEKKREILRRLSHKDPALIGRKVLVVDDDVRNIFAVTTILEQYEMNVVFAESGKQALEMLLSDREIELVLMDIMMPEMDGYEATRRIRASTGFGTIPIIALTAKAMKKDRKKCIDAGASDFITKPIDSTQLISLLRVWLFR